MKKVFRILLAAVLLIIVAGIIAVFAIDHLVTIGLERGTAYALGADTKVDRVDLSLLKGRLVIDGLHISNLEGFSVPHFMELGSLKIALKPSSLFKSTIELESFELDGLEVNIEQNMLDNNVKQILNNLERFKRDGVEKGPGGRKVKVDSLRIRNVVARFHLVPRLVRSQEFSVKVPDIELTDVTSDSPKGVVVAQLVARIVPAILAGVLKSSEGKVPGGILRDLRTRTADLTGTLSESIGEFADRIGVRFVSDRPQDARPSQR